MIIQNQEKFKEAIKKDGINSLHILADFDRTITYSTDKEGNNVSSVISILRDNDFLDKDYSKKAKELFGKYHPIEIDRKISLEEKRERMKEWWETHNKLLIESSLTKNDLEKAIEISHVRIRKGIKEFMEKLDKLNIPLVIISSSGAGEMISILLKKENLLLKNILIITNEFKWDKNGKAVGLKNSIIHCLNKDETILKDNPEIFKKIENRKNVLLLGDSLGDLGMITGFDYNNLLKIGFLNPGEEQNEEEYRNNFDIILTNDSDALEINNLIDELK